MIKSIAIENFQSHEFTRLDLAEGVNAVIGPSDSGKTAILRAVRWLVDNRPTGEEFRSTWGGETAVQVEVVDVDNVPVIVERVRGDDNNYYRIFWNADAIRAGEECPADLFKAFGTGVPEEVSRLLNLSAINIHGQHDSHFLLSDSAGEAGRYLNSIIRFDKIDSSLSTIASIIREEKGEKERREQEAAEAGVAVADYDELIPPMEEAVESLEAKFEEYKQLDDVARKGVGLVAGIAELTREKEEASQILEYAPRVDQLTAEANSISERAAEAREWERVITALETSRKAHARWKERLDTLEGDYKQAIPDTCPLCGQPWGRSGHDHGPKKGQRRVRRTRG